MEKVKWTMVRGDTLSFGVVVENATGELVDNMAFSCKTDTGAVDYVFKKTIGNGITETETGKFRVRVAPEDTENLEAGTYAIDLQIGVGSDKATPILGTLKVIEDVTREDE